MEWIFYTVEGLGSVQGKEVSRTWRDCAGLRARQCSHLAKESGRRKSLWKGLRRHLRKGQRTLSAPVRGSWEVSHKVPEEPWWKNDRRQEGMGRCMPLWGTEHLEKSLKFLERYCWKGTSIEEWVKMQRNQLGCGVCSRKFCISSKNVKNFQISFLCWWSLVYISSHFPSVSSLYWW